MTTIAFDGRYIVGDGRCTADGLILGKADRKLFSLNVTLDGEPTDVLIGTAGSAIAIAAFIRWLSKGGDLFNLEEDGFSLFGLNPNPDAANVGVIFIVRNGPAYLVTEELVPFEVEIPLVAGSGTPYALTAMSLGLNASEAVYKSMEFDSNTGGKLLAFDTLKWEWIDPDSIVRPIP
jgi:hypothetical protein